MKNQLDSALNNQRYKKKALSWLIRILPLSFALAFACWLSNGLEIPKQPIIQIDSVGLTAEQIDQIRQTIDIRKRKETIKRDILLLAPIQKISIARKSASKFHLEVASFKPDFKITECNDTFVDRGGTVFYGMTSHQTKNLPELKNFYTDKCPSETSNLDHHDHISGNLNDAMALYDTLSTSGYHPKSISYKKYIGYSVILWKSKIKIVFPLNSSSDDIAKFSEILLKLRQRGLSASRIELGYANKAFISLN